MYYNKYSKEKNISKFPHVPNKKIKIDWGLFNSLLKIRTPSESNQQRAFAKTLKKVFKKMPGVTCHQDAYGNLYAKKGKSDVYPCAIAHMDINQEGYPDLRLLRIDDWYIGFDINSGNQCGVGFDDKCGVYFCVEMLKKLDNVKIALFMDEEIGCIGSSHGHQEFFSDCSMILQLDRNSYNGPEFIYHTNGIEICDNTFMDKAQDLFDKYGYVEARGSMTDVGEVKDYFTVNCIGANIGCGYYDEHSEQEVLYIPAFENSINFAYELMVTFGHELQFHETPYYYPNNPIKPKEIEIEDRCPTCGYEDNESDLDGLTYCFHCGIYYNIPPGYETFNGQNSEIDPRDYETYDDFVAAKKAYQKYLTSKNDYDFNKDKLC